MSLNSTYFRAVLVLFASFLFALPFTGGASYFSIADYPAFPVDIVILVGLLCLPKIRFFIKMVISQIAVIVCLCMDDIKLCCVSALISFIFLLPLHEKKCKRLVYFVFGLSLAYCGWIYFLDKCFSISLLELWNLSGFYWWAMVGFFLLPIMQTLLSYFVSARVFVPKNKPIFPVKSLVILGVLAIILAYLNPLSNLFYSPFSRAYDVLVDDRVRKNPDLNPNIKEKYHVFKEDDFLDYSKPTVMILVETWGVPKDIKLLDAFFDPFDDFENVRKGVFGRAAERTQAAEWEDFHVVRDTFDAPTTIMNFSEQGFKTWYIHGFGANFYHRLIHYPKFGFDSLLYKENFQELGLAECPSGFPGICDSAIVGWMDSTILKDERSFVYWTTLGAHAPYKRKVLDKPSKYCSQFGFNLESENCIYLTFEMETLNSIAGLAKRHPEYRFILRGDHRPMNLYCDAKFVNAFYYGWVPVVVLNQ